MIKVAFDNKIVKFIKETEAELRRTNWPSREETIRYTWVVIALSAFLVVVLGGLDYCFTYAVNRFLLQVILFIEFESAIFMKKSNQKKEEIKVEEKIKDTLPDSDSLEEKKVEIKLDIPWYVIHTYAGYEDSVAKSLRQRAHSLNMEDKIFEVLVPTEKQIKIRGGKRKVIEEKIFPGYVLVQMIVTEESWYIVRNTPNVTGFVGTETTPIPLSEIEVKNLKKRMGKEEPDYDIDIAVGDAVKVVDGPFKNFDGKVEVVDRERGKIKVLVNMFSRETPVELDFLQVQKA